MDKPMSAPNPSKAPVRRPLLRGVHHLAFNTDDLRGTLDFWVRVLGMPLLHGLLTGVGGAAFASTRGSPPFDNIPHYFVDMGGDSTVAFFEFPKQGKVGTADRNLLAAMQHVSFVASPSRFIEIQQRLKDNGVPITFGPMVVIPPNIQSFYFFDPNGIRLEVSADMSGDEENIEVVRSLTMDRATMKAELLKVSDDEAWIEGMLDCMPEAPPLYPKAT